MRAPIADSWINVLSGGPERGQHIGILLQQLPIGDKYVAAGRIAVSGVITQTLDAFDNGYVSESITTADSRRIPRVSGRRCEERRDVGWRGDLRGSLESTGLVGDVASGHA